MSVQSKSRESVDDYLKAIYILSNDNSEAVRVTDIAKLMGYTKASVSRAVRNLLCDGKISLTPNKRVLLTQKGLPEAKDVYEKNKFFKNMLMSAGVDDTTADDEACRMEHAVCADSFEKLKRFIDDRSDLDAVSE